MKMDELTSLPKHDATELFDYRNGTFAAELVGVAVVTLDFFSWLAKSPADAKSICTSLGFAERPVDVMLTMISALGLIDESGGVFQPTELAREFLVHDSPRFLGPYYSMLMDRPGSRALLEVLRTGKPVGFASRKDQKPWAQEMEGDAFAQEFTAAMDSRGLNLGPTMAQALDLKDRKRLLDIGGGSGIFACCIAAAHPHIRASVFEKPPVDRVARECISRRDCSERVNVVSGDMFAGPLPGGFDIHLWSNVFHDWDASVVRTLLDKSFLALSPGGLVVVHDSFINRDKKGPRTVAACSVHLMVLTEGKCYSITEIEDLLVGAGFVSIRYLKAAVDYGVITGCKPLFSRDLHNP